MKFWVGVPNFNSFRKAINKIRQNFKNRTLTKNLTKKELRGGTKGQMNLTSSSYFLFWLIVV